jgi:hypothetical protein
MAGQAGEDVSVKKRDEDVEPRGYWLGDKQSATLFRGTA